MLQPINGDLEYCRPVPLPNQLFAGSGGCLRRRGFWGGRKDGLRADGRSEGWRWIFNVVQRDSRTEEGRR